MSKLRNASWLRTLLFLSATTFPLVQAYAQSILDYAATAPSPQLPTQESDPWKDCVEVYDPAAAGHVRCKTPSELRGLYSSGSPNLPGKPSGSEKATGTSSADPCVKAHSSAQAFCGGLVTGSAATAASAVGNTMGSSAAMSGDLVAACNAQMTMLSSQVAVNGSMGAVCQDAASKCASKCSTDPTNDTYKQYATECSTTFKSSADKMYLQAGTASLGGMQIANCLKQAQAMQCAAGNAINNTACPAQYCSLPTHASDPICTSLNAKIDCTNPQYAALAQCRSTTPASSTLLGASDSGTLPNPNGTAAGELPVVPQTTKLDKNQQNSPGVTGGNANGSGGYAGGFPGGAAGYPNPAAAGSDPKNPEVFMGTGNGSGQVDQYATHDYDASGLQRGGGDPSMRGFDLNKYLPKAGLRGPASVDANALLKSGITSSNGLSNWEKITRKMREKQPELRK